MIQQNSTNNLILQQPLPYHLSVRGGEMIKEKERVNFLQSHSIITNQITHNIRP